MKNRLFILFVGATTLAHAQAGWNPVDSVRLAMKKRPGFRLGLDGRYSFLAGNPIRVAGGRYGFDYGKVGFYTGIYSSNFVLGSDKDTTVAGFNYVSSTFEYYLYETYRFQLISTFQLGLGTAYFYSKDKDGYNKSINGAVVPLETGINGTVRFLRYFGFSIGMGIRTSLASNYGFSGPFYSYGLTFFTGTMYRDLKKAWNRSRR